MTTTFTYGLGSKLTGASTPANVTQTVVQTFRAAEAQGIGAATAGRALALDSVYSVLDGPRTDVVDVTKWWVNRFGAPRRVRNPVGLETKIVYDAVWPALAATVTGPSRLVTTTVLDTARGLPISTTTFNPLGNGVNATTQYVWHPTWDMPTQTTAPTGEITSQGLDPATGNVLWHQVGANSANRVTFDYDPSSKQLVAMYQPGIASPDRMYYDARGNDTMTVSPGGTWAKSRLDAIGRDTLVITPIDATREQSQRITYDITDQVIQTLTDAPAMPYTLAGTAAGYQDATPVSAETLVVRMQYDREGNVTRVQKFARPNPRPWINCDAPVGQCAGITELDTGSVDIKTYDNLNRMLSQRLSSSGKSFDYDLAGNVIEQQTWSNKRMLMSYDAGNRMTRRITPSVTELEERCDLFALPVLHKDNPNASWCDMKFPMYPTSGTSLFIPTDTTRWVFDANGNLAGAYNNVSRVNRTYLATGAIDTDKLTFRDYAGSLFNLSYTLDYDYDLSGRRKTLATPWGNITYVYDIDRGMLADVWHGNSHVRFTYDRAGRQDSLLIGSGANVGVRESRRYNDDDQLINRVRTSPILGYLIIDTLGYDSRGKTRYVGTQSLSTDVRSLETVTHYGGLGAVVAQHKYNAITWDLEQFRTSAMGDVYRSQAYQWAGSNSHIYPTLSTYNALGALINRGPVRDGRDGASLYSDTMYTAIDRDGNVIRTGTGFRAVGGGSEQDTYTRSYFAADNKLRYTQRYTTGASRSGSWEEYWYDALGRKILTRARRDSLCGGAGNYCASYIERTIWDGNQLLYEMRGEGADTALASSLNNPVRSGLDYGSVGYVHAGGIDAPLVLMDGRVPNYNWRGLGESSVWLDGSAADCTVATGGTTCTRIVWPSTGVYMRPASNPGGSAQPKWVGSLLANGVGSTGLAYRRNRFYDGATGQFNQQDPIGLAGGANTYGFASGDPVNFSDPFGLTGCRVKSWCNALDAANKMALKFMGRSNQATDRIPAGQNIPVPGGTTLKTMTATAVALSKSEDGKSVTLRAEGNVMVKGVTPAYLPDPVIKKASLDLGSGNFEVNGDVLVGFQVAGNIREATATGKFGWFSFSYTMPDRKSP